MKEQDDIYHVQRVLAGNTAAFAVLVDKHKDLAFNIALKIVRHREDAEEIAQDAFMKAYQSLRSFKGDSKFSTWLYRIVYNAAISHTRKKQQEFTQIDDRVMSDTTEDDILEDLERVDGDLQTKLVNQAIDRLPPDESALVTLFYMEENSIDDISHITGLSVSNVKVKLHRIRKKLYEELQGMMVKAAMV
ncbi:MAG: sigma-70 family RNA polymerase sigma factor [Bacteroidales bacterium]|nr:sigma-70 family RNA polymerase sigma factor [Bacteroidales bacterium]